MQSIMEKFSQWGWQAVGVAAAIIVLLVLWLVVRAAFGGRIRAAGGGRARQPRLGVVEEFELDRQRQLVLVRRDNVEHLIMVGGPNDLLIESVIVRAIGAERGRPQNQFEDFNAPAPSQQPVAAQFHPPLAPMQPLAPPMQPVAAQAMPAPAAPMPPPSLAAPGVMPERPMPNLAPAPARRPPPVIPNQPLAEPLAPQASRETKPAPIVSSPRPPPIFGRAAVSVGGLAPKPAEPAPPIPAPTDSARAAPDLSAPKRPDPPAIAADLPAPEAPTPPMPDPAPAKPRFDFSKLAPRAANMKAPEPPKPVEPNLAPPPVLQMPDLPKPDASIPPAPMPDMLARVSPKVDFEKLELSIADAAPPAPKPEPAPEPPKAATAPIPSPAAPKTEDAQADALLDLEAEMAKLLGRPS